MKNGIIKRAFAVVVLLVLSFVMLSVSVEAEDDCIIWRFDSEDIIKTVHRNAVNLTLYDDVMQVHFTEEENPLFYIRLPKEERFNAEEYPIVKIRYRADVMDDTIIFYYCFTDDFQTDAQMEFFGEKCVSAHTQNGGWVEETYDFSELADNFSGELKGFRVDPVGVVFDCYSEYFLVEYIGFFRNEEAAAAYKGVSDADAPEEESRPQTTPEIKDTVPDTSSTDMPSTDTNKSDTTSADTAPAEESKGVSRVFLIIAAGVVIIAAIAVITVLECRKSSHKNGN